MEWSPRTACPEFLAEMHGELGFVLEEVLMEAFPDEGGGAGGRDDVEVITGDGGVEPQNNRIVVTPLEWVGETGGGAVLNLRLGVVPSNDKVDVVPPPGEVGAIKRQLEVDDVRDASREATSRRRNARRGERDWWWGWVGRDRC